jgi:hypothetical protein
MVVKLETLVKRLVLCVAVSCVCGCGGDGDTTGADAGLRDLAAGADLTAATDAAIANHTRNIRGVFHQTGGTDPKRNCTSCHGLDLRGGGRDQVATTVTMPTTIKLGMAAGGICQGHRLAVPAATVRTTVVAWEARAVIATAEWR